MIVFLLALAMAACAAVIARLVLRRLQPHETSMSTLSTVLLIAALVLLLAYLVIPE